MTRASNVSGVFKISKQMTRTPYDFGEMASQKLNTRLWNACLLWNRRLPVRVACSEKS